MDTQNKYCGYIICVERDKIYSPQAQQNQHATFYKWQNKVRQNRP